MEPPLDLPLISHPTSEKLSAAMTKYLANSNHLISVVMIWSMVVDCADCQCEKFCEVFGAVKKQVQNRMTFMVMHHVLMYDVNLATLHVFTLAFMLSITKL